MTDHEFQLALDEFKAAKLTANTDFCTIYKKVRPILNVLAAILKVIPIWGATAAEAVTLLVAALDKLCPAAV